MQVVANEFEEWRQHPVTKGVFKALYNEREMMKENLVQSNYDSENELKVKGRCQAIGLILTMTHEELVTSLKESYAK